MENKKEIERKSNCNTFIDNFLEHGQTNLKERKIFTESEFNKRKGECFDDCRTRINDNGEEIKIPEYILHDSDNLNAFLCEDSEKYPSYSFLYMDEREKEDKDKEKNFGYFKKYEWVDLYRTRCISQLKNVRAPVEKKK